MQLVDMRHWVQERELTVTLTGETLSIYGKPQICNPLASNLINVLYFYIFYS